MAHFQVNEQAIRTAAESSNAPFPSCYLVVCLCVCPRQPCVNHGQNRPQQSKGVGLARLHTPCPFLIRFSLPAHKDWAESARG